LGASRILVVDFDPVIRSGISRFLADQGFLVSQASDGRDARTQLQRSRPDALVLDAHLPNADAAELMAEAGGTLPRLPVLLLTKPLACSSEPPAFSASADEVVIKPVDMTELHTALLRLLRKRNSGEARKLIAASLPGDAPNPFVGSSPAIVQLRHMAARIAASESPVLIRGETGTGKGVLARWIHQNSPRAKRPFVDLNCAGLGRELLESELFGHRKGAFTSAVLEKQGLLEVAEGGTVFLDEIGDMDLQVQSKLLKVLEERVFRRLGDVRDRAVDMRLISATHCELQGLVREQRFRSDLYFRVNIVWLQLPPLRERREDIAPLAQRLIASLARRQGRHEFRISAAAMGALESYSWPGNIRELRNVLERALVLADSALLRAEHLEFPSAAPAELFTAGRGHGTLRQMERAYISHVLVAERGSVERAARRLGIPRSSLYNKMRRFAIPQGTGRPDCELPFAAD
jgi:DNA-binding NtrC family response regulator